MATLYADNYTAAFTDGDRVSPASAGGTLHVISDTYTFAAAATASTVTIGAAKLPKGARVIKASLRTGATLGANTTCALSAGSDTIITAAATTSAVSLVEDFAILDTATAADSYLVVTTGGAGTATGKIEVKVFYTFH